MTTDGMQQSWTRAEGPTADRDEILLREQHRALARLVPVLYLVVILATLSIMLAFSSRGSAMYSTWLPGLVLIPVVLRMRYWLAMRKKAEAQDAKIIRRDILGTTILGPAIAGGFMLIGVAILFEGSVHAQAVAGILIWIIATASAFCVAAVPMASILIVVSTTLPLVGALLYTGDDLMMTVAGVVTVVGMQVIYMLTQIYAGFRGLVRSRARVLERQQAAEQSSRIAMTMALTDHLTGLPNRRHFERLLSERVHGSAFAEARFAVAILDLDHFKPINDTYGHSVGDSVLFEVAKRLQSVTGERGVVARMGGDEFALLLPDFASEEQALAFAREVHAVIRRPLETLHGRLVQIDCSIGFALFPESTIDAGRLIDLADMALYESKSAERGTATVFSAHYEEAALRRGQIEQGLRAAIAAESLDVHFQPILDLQSGDLIGFEALARWTDSELGVVSPAAFIPVAEQAGLIEAITEVLMRKAARIAATWPNDIFLSFNLSPEQIIHPSAGLRIAKTLAECGLPMHRFEAEITETALTRDVEAARATIECLRQAGARVSLDDFGTGHSSLSQIRNLPLDKVKIDKSFVDQISTDPRMRNLVEAIIVMCDRLGLRCVAEGIEHQEQADILRMNGCHGGQGYLFARPLAAPDAKRLIVARALRQNAA